MARTKGEKKIDTWSVTHNQETASIDVYMRRGENGATFVARSAELDIRLDNPNIDELQTAVFAEAKSKMSRTYERFFQLTFTGHGRGENRTFKPDAVLTNGTDSAESKLNVEILYVTTDEGKKLSKRHPTGSPSPYRTPLIQGYEIGKQAALIPDTPENRVALGRIFAAYEQLNNSLRGLLNADAIQANFIKLAAGNGNLLTAAAGESKE